jgi:hypothetical protein
VRAKLEERREERGEIVELELLTTAAVKDMFSGLDGV